jgi:hypothetical protein
LSGRRTGYFFQMENLKSEGLGYVY